MAALFAYADWVSGQQVRYDLLVYLCTCASVSTRISLTSNPRVLTNILHVDPRADAIFYGNKDHTVCAFD